jgi:hypothetical protein
MEAAKCVKKFVICEPTLATREVSAWSPDKKWMDIRIKGKENWRRCVKMRGAKLGRGRIRLNKAVGNATRQIRRNRTDVRTSRPTSPNE